MWLRVTTAVRSSSDRVHVLDGDPAAGRRLQPDQLQVEVAGQRLDDIPVGGEVVPVQHHPAPARPQVQRRAHRLVEVHRGGVGDHRLPGARAERGGGQFVADDLRQFHPALRPAADQPAGPLLRGELVPGRGDRGQRPAERIAVQVGDDVVGLRQVPAAEGGERVRRVQLPAPVLG